MKVHEHIKPGLYGAAAGAVALAVLGFTWGGWVTGGTAKDMAKKASDTAVIEVLVPLCVANYQAQPDFDVKLAALMEEDSDKRERVIRDGGWATIPTGANPNLAVARLCTKELLKTAS